MSTLGDRYVWAVLRAVPEARRDDLEPEIRALVADSVDARGAAGVEPAEAERAAIMDLGDPERLAARYTDTSLFLIGPRYFTEWKRLLSLLLTTVVPIVAIAVAGATLLGHMDDPGGAGIAEAVWSAIGTGLTTGIMVTFWVTVGFAIAERKSAPDLDEGLAWSPDRLPHVPEGRSTESLVGIGFSIAALALAVAALVWQQATAPIAIDDASYMLFNPDLWSFWLPYFVGLLGLEILFHVVLYARGGWTWAFAVLNAALNLAFLVPALWLWSEGRLLDAGLVAALDGMGLTEVLRSTGVVIAILIVVTAGWDVVDGFRKAARAGRSRRHDAAG